MKVVRLGIVPEARRKVLDRPQVGHEGVARAGIRLPHSRLTVVAAQTLAHTELGRVEGVVVTGGADLLSVRETGAEEDDELLIPLVEEIVRKFDEARGRLEVRLPRGLLDLNREKR